EIIAESGNNRSGNWLRVRRKIDGEWQPVPVQTDYAFPLAKGTRAVLDGRLLTEDGRTFPLYCDDGDPLRLRASPDGKHLVCVQRDIRKPSEEDGATTESVSASANAVIAIVTRNLNGVKESERRVVPPVLKPADAPVLSMDIDTSFLGFIPAGLVFAVEVIDYVHPQPTGTPHVCTAYVLGADDSWRKLGSLSYQDSDAWKCNFPWPWKEALGYEITMGAYATMTNGEPHRR
ncbi:MAG: hypothetical protein ABI461_19985, partial [Polyangiaceae bacterium]